MSAKDQSGGGAVILVFEDDPQAREYFRRVLAAKYTVRDFASVEEGLDQIDGAALILSDWDMPGLGGEGLVAHLEGMESPPPMIVISGLSLFDDRLATVRRLALPYLAKPITAPSLLRQIDFHLMD